MIDRLKANISWMENRISKAQSTEKIGTVSKMTGLIIESIGPEVPMGEVCSITSLQNGSNCLAQVVGFRDAIVLLMPLTTTSEIHPGCQVIAKGKALGVPAGDQLIGRIIDGMGNPIDGKGPILSEKSEGINNDPPNPMERNPIKESYQTGVKALDTFVPLGKGQRLGIFSGTGVGKSVLLGMISRGSQSDVNVIALVGERGRELREFVDNELGEEGLKKSVVVVSTSDQPGTMRVRAAMLATTIAENFRDQQKDVLFLMDSVTRFAMAQREIGLAVGEPPATKGYTPSVFSVLPRLLERTGVNEKGAITAIYTVLVEGDDMNAPIADAVRGILDGHIILSRELANANHFPAIDILSSISRLDRIICSPEEMSIISEARDLLSVYKSNEDLINVGAYTIGTNPKIDRAIEKHDLLIDFRTQTFKDLYPRQTSFEQLAQLMQ